jgi:hypothetical protein
MKTYIAVMLFVSMFIPSCVLDPGFKDPNNARIEVATTTGSGVGAISTSLTSIDGESVPEDQIYVEVPPGEHKVEFDYEKILEMPSRFSVSLSVLGETTDLVSQKEGSRLFSNQPLPASGTLASGKTYIVDASQIRAEYVDAYPSFLNIPYQRMAVAGEAFLREKVK